MDFISKQSWFFSILGHLIIFAGISNVFSFQKKIDLPKEQKKVVWTQLQSKKKTPDYKLPPPKVLPTVEPKKEEPKKIAPIEKEKKKEKVLTTPKEEPKKELSREEKLKEALASLPKEEDRPTPKENNFSDQVPDPNLLSAGEIGLLQTTSEFIEYKSFVEKTITANFIWIREQPSSYPIIQFFILPNGEISEPKVLQNSDNASYDQAAIRAIQKSSPLQAPPQALHQMFRQEAFQLNFDRSHS
ncbi:MAG: TonB C-terminal domain-containing protein [Bdellovibrionales bacterium]|nr:TonB C-terminal domain-containing protein [Bdellovibrionales bacterium]